MSKKIWTLKSEICLYDIYSIALWFSNFHSFIHFHSWEKRKNPCSDNKSFKEEFNIMVEITTKSDVGFLSMMISVCLKISNSHLREEQQKFSSSGNRFVWSKFKILAETTFKSDATFLKYRVVAGVTWEWI